MRHVTHFTRTALLAALSVLLVSPALAQDNLISFGDFESLAPGTTSGIFTPGFTQGDGTTYTIVDDVAHTGDQSLRVDYPGGAAEFYSVQAVATEIPVTPGMEYTFSVWARTGGSDGDGQLAFGVLDPNYGPVVAGETVNYGTAITGDWQEFTFTFTVPAEAAYSTVNVVTQYGFAANEGESVYVDDLSLMSAASETSDLIITGVVDGPLPGGLPKAVELYVVSDVADLGVYGLGSANNADGTNGVEFAFPAGASASAGDFLYVASETEGFESFFGFAPDYTSDAANINGDDSIELFYDASGVAVAADVPSTTSVVDVFGEVGTDGTDQPWEHLDGWAYRADGTGPDGSTFVLDNWTFSGIDALDNETSNASAATPFPIGTYASDGGGEEPLVTIAEARAAGVGETVTVEGTVSRAAGSFLYLQDDTGGLTIRQVEGAFFDAVADGSIAPGTTIQVTGTLSEYNQLLQINDDDLTDFEVVGTADVPEPQTVTLAELAADGEAFEGELVRVEDATVQGTGEFAAATTYGLDDGSDAGGVITLRVPNAGDTTVEGTPIPDGPATLVGVVGQFNFDDPTTGYQLLLLDADDVTEGAAPSGDLVTNGGFESSDVGVIDDLADGVEGWLFETNAAVPTAPEYAIVDDVVYEGDRALRVTVNEVGTASWNIQAVAEDIPVTPGETYVYSVWARSENGGGSAAFTVGNAAFDEYGALRNNVMLTDEWQEYTFEFTINDAETVARAPIHFSFEANEGNPIYIDNLSIQQLNVSNENGPEGAVASLTVRNPIRSTATVRYAVDTPGPVTIALFDMLGRRVVTLADGPVGTTEQVATLDATRLAAGVYVLQLRAGTGVVSRTVTVVR